MRFMRRCLESPHRLKRMGWPGSVYLQGSYYLNGDFSQGTEDGSGICLQLLDRELPPKVGEACFSMSERIAVVLDALQCIVCQMSGGFVILSFGDHSEFSQLLVEHQPINAA